MTSWDKTTSEWRTLPTSSLVLAYCRQSLIRLFIDTEDFHNILPDTQMRFKLWSTHSEPKRLIYKLFHIYAIKFWNGDRVRNISHWKYTFECNHERWWYSFFLFFFFVAIQVTLSTEEKVLLPCWVKKKTHKSIIWPYFFSIKIKFILFAYIFFVGICKMLYCQTWEHFQLTPRNHLFLCYGGGRRENRSYYKQLKTGI